MISAGSGRIRALFSSLSTRARGSWRWYRTRPVWQQLVIGALVIALFVTLIVLARGGEPEAAGPQTRIVTLASVGSLSGTENGIEVIGTVRSRDEAILFAQSGGVVRRANATLGQQVGAGTILLELENDAERAAVAQASAQVQGALASRVTTSLQAEGARIRASGAGSARTNAELDARNAYARTFTALDTTLQNDIDTFFGNPTAVGPDFRVNADYDVASSLSRERTRIGTLLLTYRQNLPRANARPARSLVEEAERTTSEVQEFANRIAVVANATASDATPEQIAALASARATLNTLLAQLASIDAALDAAATADLSSAQDAQIAGSGIASADAQVASARASLQAARAGFERTIVRAPISGQVNVFDLGVGDYVAPGQQVAVVAQNGALEIVAYVSEEDRQRIIPGGTVTIEGGATGVVTAIAPALDPLTRRVEVRIGINAGSTLINGETVRLSLPVEAAVTETAEGAPTLLPLAAVKLRAEDRVVFSVDAENRLVAYRVEVGEVRGDRIEVLTELDPGLRIVADARGLTEGEAVTVAP